MMLRKSHLILSKKLPWTCNHGHVTIYLLLATLVPIIKNKTSNNYRSIAISSLVLKILDWIILTLFGQKVGLDELQFAYQQESSTMCTWAVM